MSVYIAKDRGEGGWVYPPVLDAGSPPRLRRSIVVRFGWLHLYIYIYRYIYRYAFFSVSQDRGVHPPSFRPGVRDVTMFYLRRLGRRLHLMSRLLCGWNRLLCSKAFLQWYAESQGYSHACVCLLGFMSVLIFVFGCHVCVCGRVVCIGMQNGRSIRALVRAFVSVGPKSPQQVQRTRSKSKEQSVICIAWASVFIQK